MLGEKLRELREARGLVQRQIAAELEVDTAYISKMESNEKPVSRHHLKKLAALLSISEKELLIIWLANKILRTIDEEEYKEQAMQLALKTLK
jgi:transcriptional regulator with XRE-family HTH domain